MNECIRWMTLDPSAKPTSSSNMLSGEKIDGKGVKWQNGPGAGRATERETQSSRLILPSALHHIEHPLLLPAPFQTDNRINIHQPHELWNANKMTYKLTQATWSILINQLFSFLSGLTLDYSSRWCQFLGLIPLISAPRYLCHMHVETHSRSNLLRQPSVSWCSKLLCDSWCDFCLSFFCETAHKKCKSRAVAPKHATETSHLGKAGQMYHYCSQP